MTNPKDLKTIGLTQFSYHSNHALLGINPGTPVITALAHASDLLQISKLLTADTSISFDPERHVMASRYLQDLSKALIDDVVKVLGAAENNPPP
jgi:hypothetical protein